MSDQLLSLSQRGQDLASNPARVDLKLFFEAMGNLYHGQDNPNGSILLNVAENVLMSKVMHERIRDVWRTNNLPDWTMQYTDGRGHEDLRKVLGQFMRTHFDCASISEENVAIAAGASAILEIFSFLVGNSHDVVGIPAPAYPMYTKDFGIKSGLRRYDIHAQNDDLRKLTCADLDRARDEANRAGDCLKLITLTSPDNPTGACYSYPQLEAIADWCHENRVHLLVNEIYFLSRTSPGHDKSFATIMADHRSPYLHQCWALSKDFGLSGFRFGVLHTHSEALLEAFGNVAIPHMVSNPIQWTMSHVLADDKFVEEYIAENQRMLRQSRKIVEDGLADIGVPFVTGEGSLFVWADFSKWLTESTDEAEMTLWQSIYKDTDVLLTPGVGFGHRQKGWFRIVYSAVDQETLTVAMERLKNFAV